MTIVGKLILWLDHVPPLPAEIEQGGVRLRLIGNGGHIISIEKLAGEWGNRGRVNDAVINGRRFLIRWDSETMGRVDAVSGGGVYGHNNRRLCCRVSAILRSAASILSGLPSLRECFGILPKSRPEKASRSLREFLKFAAKQRNSH